MRPEDVLVIEESAAGAHPAVGAGMLLMEGLTAAGRPAQLDAARVELEDELRAQHAGRDRASLALLSPFPSYIAYYKRFKKTYHVLLQLESVALKQRAIASPNGLVTAMFMAELKTGLLSAGHDPRTLELPLRLLAAAGGERFQSMSGEDKRLKAGDLHMADARGIVSSVIYGPDQRTKLGPGSPSVLYTVYAVPGVTPEAVMGHLDLLQSFVLRLHPQALTVVKATFQS